MQLCLFPQHDIVSCLTFSEISVQWKLFVPDHCVTVCVQPQKRSYMKYTYQIFGIYKYQVKVITDTKNIWDLGRVQNG